LQKPPCFLKLPPEEDRFLRRTFTFTYSGSGVEQNRLLKLVFESNSSLHSDVGCSMSEFPSSGSGAIKNPALVDAIQRAKQVASKIQPNEGSFGPGLKRPLNEDFEAPGRKKSAPGNDFFDKMQGGVNEMGGGPQGMVTNEIIGVPDKMVGLIIGRGGEQISRLQADTGCKIQMAPESGGLDRQCTLTGSPASIAAAKSAIDRIISSEGSGPRGGPMGSGYFEMSVPGHKVGLIIGKGGETIKQLQETSGAKIVIVQDTAEFADEKPLRITGSSDSVERAKGMITDILTQNDERDMGFGGRGRGGRGGRAGMPRGGGGGFMPRGRGRGGGFGDRGPGGPGQWGGAGDFGGGGGGQHQDYVSVPTSKCGLIIGKGGETIKSINQSSGAHCEVDKNAPPDAREKNFIIRGSPEAVERAKAMIMEKLGGPSGPGGGSSYGGASANYGGSWGGQYQSAPAGGFAAPEPVSMAPQQAGQADYSAQWIEYYRSMGMTREAEAIEQTMRAARATSAQAAAPAPAANGTANGAPDYSAQWIDYYRSIGKHEEAKAIELQMKQKAAATQAYAAPAAQFPGAGFYGGTPPAASTYPGYPGYSGYGQPTGNDA